MGIFQDIVDNNPDIPASIQPLADKIATAADKEALNVGMKAAAVYAGNIAEEARQAAKRRAEEAEAAQAKKEQEAKQKQQELDDKALTEATKSTREQALKEVRENGADSGKEVLHAASAQLGLSVASIPKEIAELIEKGGLTIDQAREILNSSTSTTVQVAGNKHNIPEQKLTDDLIARAEGGSVTAPWDEKLA